MAVICLMTGAIYAAPVFAMEEKGETDLASMTSEVIGEIVPDTVAGGMSAEAFDMDADGMSADNPNTVTGEIFADGSDALSSVFSDEMPDDASDAYSDVFSDKLPDDTSDVISDELSDEFTDEVSDELSDDGSDMFSDEISAIDPEMILEEASSEMIDETTEETADEDAALLAASNVPDYDDECGNGGHYHFDSKTGRLTISGNGDLGDLWIINTGSIFEIEPMEGNTEAVTSIEILEGVTSINAGSFDYFTNAFLVIFPHSFRQSTARGLLDVCGESGELRFIYVNDENGDPVYKGYLVDETTGELFYYKENDRPDLALNTQEDVQRLDLSLFAGDPNPPKVNLHKQVTLFRSGSLPDPCPEFMVYPGSQPENFLEREGIDYEWGYEYNLFTWAPPASNDYGYGSARMYSILTLDEISFPFANEAAAFAYPQDFYFLPERFREVYNDSAAAQKIYETKKAKDRSKWRGNCFGMCAASLLKIRGNMEYLFWWHDDEEKTSGPPDPMYLDCGDPPVAAGTAVRWKKWTDHTDTVTPVSLRDVIEKLQVGQLSFPIQRAYHENEDQLDRILSLSSARGSQYREPFLVMITGPGGGVHIVTAYAKVYVTEQLTKLYVYDPNYPNTKRFISIETSGGVPVGWSYPMGNGVVYSSKRKGSIISAAPVSAIAEIMENMGSLSGDNYDAVMPADGACLRIFDGAGNLAAVVENNALTSYSKDIFSAVTVSGNEKDALSVFYLPSDGSYTIENDTGKDVEITTVSAGEKITSQVIKKGNSGDTKPDDTIEDKAENKTENKTENKAAVPFLRLNARSVVLKKGQATTGLTVSMQKGDRITSVKSSKKKIVKVSIKDAAKGIIRLKGKKTGKATVTIKLESGLSKKVTVKVQKSKVKTKKLRPAGDRTLTLKKGKQYVIRSVRTPFTSQEKITYASSDKKTAAVNKKGVIRAKKPGRARITVRSGKRKYVLTVIVSGK